MSVVERIHVYLAGQGVPVTSVIEDTPGAFRAVLDPSATAAQVTTAQQACASPPAASADEKGDGLNFPPRLAAALALRFSDSWAAASPAAQAWATRVINSAGAAVSQSIG